MGPLSDCICRQVLSAATTSGSLKPEGCVSCSVVFGFTPRVITLLCCGGLFSAYANSLAMPANRMQAHMPIAVGRAAASPVHFQLPVSFLMVSGVVEQGQCMSENSMTLMAVTQVQPLATNSCFISARLPS